MRKFKELALGISWLWMPILGSYIAKILSDFILQIL